MKSRKEISYEHYAAKRHEISKGVKKIIPETPGPAYTVAASSNDRSVAWQDVHRHNTISTDYARGSVDKHRNEKRHSRVTILQRCHEK